MKSLMLVFVSMLFLLAGCGANICQQSVIDAANEDTTPSDSFGSTVGDNMDYGKISVEEAKRIIDGGEPYILLDVRTEAEYLELRIDGAVLIPHSDITVRAPVELPDKSATILVYCRSGVRSAAASEALAKMGYDHVYDIGGIIDWPYETVSGTSIHEENSSAAKLLFQGHGSFRVTTSDGKVIYIDPYAGGGYDLPADLIMVTHQHSDHNQISLIASRNPGCEVITEKEALKDGKHQTFDFGYVTVEAVEAGNKNHDPAQCVGYILTLDGSIQVYFSGDTSTTSQMSTFAERKLDYAILCCDGIYNMDIAEASECAALIGARHSIPCHMAPGKLFDRERAEQFEADGRLIISDGEEIMLEME